MKAISINPEKQTSEEIAIEMQANTVYSFFGSILIDESTTLKDHTIYTDANAVSESKKAFFIGEQLLLGNTLITGVSPKGDVDSSIPLEDLESLVSYDVNQFYRNVLELIAATDVNLYRPFIASKNEEEIALSIEWVIYTFNIADDRTKEYFLNELKKAVGSTEETEAFMQKMAGLALNAS
ncbi:hypothetical protein N9X61_02070 [Sulfurimonas sp.]|nr:hypothetical protein [Sulfurimonas sp.]